MELKLDLFADPKTKEYYDYILKTVQKQFDLASEARGKSKDIENFVECLPVTDLAERIEKLVGPKGVAERFRKVVKDNKGNRLDSLFQIFREIIESKEGSWIQISELQKRVEQAIKTALVIMTEGVVVSPLDGLPKVLISKNPDGSKYVDIYFAGPIRAAGGSATVIPVILGDYARTLLKLDRYKPTSDEVERYVEEISIYQEEIISRQYKLSNDEIRIIVKGCPVCINGVPTEEREVSVHRNLDRIPTNRVRGGMGLVISEGIALKAMKILSWANKLGLDWSWLEKIIKVKKTQDKITEIKPVTKYLEGLAAGRPLLAYPSKTGGFRLRYGRSRNSSIMGKAINPALMHLLDEFIAVGTHIKIERPGKAAQLFPCETIEGPIVLLNNGEVKKIRTIDEAQKIKAQVKKILFLGDILITVGDFRKTAHPLIPAGYVEEWWKLELEKAFKEGKKTEINENIIKEIIKSFEKLNSLDFETAKKISENLEIALHPKFIFYYTALNQDEIFSLIKEIKKGKFSENNFEIEIDENNDNKGRSEVKKMLEKIGLPHKIIQDKIIIEGDNAKAFAFTLGFEKEFKPETYGIDDSSIEVLSKTCGLQIKDKGGSFIGARMGRPEAAKEREMKGNPHCLFPIGLHGGATRSINKAADSMDEKSLNYGNKEIEVALFKCHECGSLLHSFYCQKCKVRTSPIRICPHCSRTLKHEECPACKIKTIPFHKRKINLRKLFTEASRTMNEPIPHIVKGVKGMISENKIPESLEKGILRAKHDIHVFRDGTSRFELLNAPITHFTPKEIGLNIEQVKELGYKIDVNGNSLENDMQLIEMFPQDIIINEKGGDWMLKISKFIDDLLEKFYGLERFYNAETKHDLIGELVIGLAPHTSAGIVARIIGYTKSKLGWGHPYFIMTKRRNCVVGETQVLAENSGNIELIPIDCFDNGSAEEEIPLENIWAYAIDKKGNLKRRKVKSLIKNEAPEELIKIKTKYGREIITTKDHKMLVANMGCIKEKPVEELSEGNQLISLRKINKEKTLAEINVLEFYMQKIDAEKKKLRIHGVGRELKKIIDDNGGCWKISEKINKKNEKLYNEKKLKKENEKTGKKIHTALSFDSIPLDLYEKILSIKKIKLKEKDKRKITISYNKQKSTIPAVIKLNKELGELIGYFLADGYARTTSNGKRLKYVYQINFVSAEPAITERIKQNAKKIFGREITLEKRSGLDYITLSGRAYYDFFVNLLGTGKKAGDKHLPMQILNSDKEVMKAALAGYITGDSHINGNSIKISSVNRNLINEFSLLCSFLGIFPHVFSEKERTIKTGRIKEFYEKKGKTKTIKSYGIRIYSTDINKIGELLIGGKKIKFQKIKKEIQRRKKRIKTLGNFAVDPIKSIKKIRNKGKYKYVYDLVVEKEKNYIGGFGQLGVFDCDGDQDSIMLMLDALLNFSHHYLSGKSGGKMDAPLVFTIALNPTEIDDEVYETETCREYPLELYEKAKEFYPPYIDSITVVEKKLNKEDQYINFWYTHPTETFDMGPKQSMYTQLKAMEEKIRKQADLQFRIDAVDGKDSLERVLRSHFFPDIIGNARAFSKQKFRCAKCNAKYRRVPLKGVCTKCGNNLIMTIAEGSVRKYLEVAKKMINEYGLSNYLKQRIALTEEEINSIFKCDNVQQKNLFEFV